MTKKVGEHVDEPLIGLQTRLFGHADIRHTLKHKHSGGVKMTPELSCPGLCQAEVNGAFIN